MVMKLKSEEALEKELNHYSLSEAKNIKLVQVRALSRLELA